MPKEKKEIFPPGDHLAAELRARKWTINDFVKTSELQHHIAWDILHNNRKITNHTAAKIAQALGTSARLWLNLEEEYQRSIK